MEGKTDMQYSEAPESLCLTLRRISNSVGIGAIQQMEGRSWAGCQFWLRLKGKIICWRESELYRKLYNAMDYLHTQNIIPIDRIQLYCKHSNILH